MSRSRRDRAEIASRTRRAPLTLAPRYAGFSARATRTAGIRSSATSCATRSTRCSASPSTPPNSPSRPCPRYPAATPLASNRGVRPPQVCVPGPLPRRPRVPRPGAMDPRNGRDRAEPRVRSARQIAFSAAAEAHILRLGSPPSNADVKSWSHTVACHLSASPCISHYACTAAVPNCAIIIYTHLPYSAHIVYTA